MVYLLAFTAGALAVSRVPFRTASLWPAATGRPSTASSAGSNWAASLPPQPLTRGTAKESPISESSESVTRL